MLALISFGKSINIPAAKVEAYRHCSGTDSAGLAPGTAHGLSLHQELEYFVKECGFTPIEALRSGTSLTAKRLNFSDRGQIREGMRADLALVEGDPTNDITHTLDLRATWIAGRLCSYYKDKI